MEDFIGFIQEIDWIGSAGVATPRVNLSSTSVAEDASIGTVVGALSVSNLPAGVTVSSWAITADPDTKFDISGSNLITEATLDYETATSHSVTIQATLSDASTVSRTFTITVNDVDDTAPTLSSATDVATSDTTADVGVDTDEANGTLYCVVTTSGTAPTATQVKAGQDNAGAAAAFADSQAIASTGTKSFSATGLTAATAYTAHFMHEDAAANQSSVISGDGFTTDSAFDSDAETYFAAMSVAPDATRKGHIDDLIVGLKSDGVWAKLDFLNLFAAHHEQAGRVNAKTPSQVTSLIGTPTFTTDRGFLGNGTDAKLNSGKTGQNYTRTDFSMFVYVDVKSSINIDPVMGYRAGLHGIEHGGTLAPRGNIASANDAGGLTTAADDQFVCVARTGTTVELNVGTTQEGSLTVSDNTTGEGNNIHFLGHGNGGFSAVRLSAAGMASYLTSAERTALRNRLRTYLIAVGAMAYDADAQSYFSAMSVAPDATRKGLINDLIVGLKADGVWTKLDFLNLLAAHHEQAGRVNAKTPSQVTSLIGTPTFTTDRGFLGNGTDAKLDSGKTGLDYTRTNFSMFAYVDVKAVASDFIMGYRGSTHAIGHGGTAAIEGRVATATTSLSLTTSANDQFVCVARTGTTQELHVGTTQEDSDTVTDSTVSQSNGIHFLGNGLGGHVAVQLSAAGMASYLTSTERTALRNRLRTYLIAVGAI